MATKITNKKPLSGNNRSHALNATKRVQRPNLQKKLLMEKKLLFLQEKQEQLINKNKNTGYKNQYFLFIFYKIYYLKALEVLLY